MIVTRYVATWLVIVLFSLIALPLAHAGEAAERKVLDDIRAENPDAVPVYEQAVATLDHGDTDGARALFRRVTELAPKSDHAYRRLCRLELVYESWYVEAVPDCRRALALREATENHLMLARALVEPEEPSAESVQEALEHATQALAQKPEDPHALNAMIRVQLARKDIERAEAYVGHLEQVAPRDPQTYALLARVRLLAGDRSGAEGALEQAEEKGLPYGKVVAIRHAIQGASPAWPWLVRFACAVGIWLGTFALLFLLGWTASQIVLRFATRVPLFVLRAYQGVLWLSSVYFYLSLPILLGLCGSAGVLVFIEYGTGTDSWAPFLSVATVTLFTLAAVGKAIWGIAFPPASEDPGEPMDLASEPKWRALLEDVAHRMGTRPVDRVFLTKGATFGITHRGTGWLGLGGERWLTLGVAMLAEDMSVRTFKVLLAREIGRFKTEDAAGGFALTMQRSLDTMTNTLTRLGADRWYSPAWLFLRAFERVFASISSGARQLQETLAEREAALAYGSASFERAIDDDHDVRSLFVG
ncbi:tetratricopeptide repeat protein [Pendulispora brunnea]|uniref:Tetratricopeptide repeat protein n=1 Tax=Pendulispora brunnea TaxID=2905690 RepID=A0ABZ2KIU7_9BACT